MKTVTEKLRSINPTAQVITCTRSFVAVNDVVNIGMFDQQKWKSVDDAVNNSCRVSRSGTVCSCCRVVEVAGVDSSASLSSHLTGVVHVSFRTRGCVLSVAATERFLGEVLWAPTAVEAGTCVNGDNATQIEAFDALWEVYRSKGSLCIRGDPPGFKRYFQGVGRLFEISEPVAVGGSDGNMDNVLVFIGRNLDAERIRLRFLDIVESQS